MSKVALCIPELGVTKVRFPKERKSELYVMAFTCDGRSPGTDSTGKPAPKGNNSIAAANETLPNLEPEVMELSALRYTYVAVSNLFPGVKAEKSVPLMGSGIVLYPNMDPRGMVHTYIAVIDSDQGTRDVGKTLTGLFADKAVKGVVDQLAKAGSGNQLYAQLFNAIINKLPSFLSKDKDDLLLASQFSGFDYDNYGCDAGTTRKDFQRGNDRAWMKLRVMVN